MNDFLHLKDHMQKLVYLDAVARTGSISLAARQLRLSQSAISHAVAKLEDLLEVELIVRKSRGVDLTGEGESLARFSRRILGQLEDLEVQLKHPDQDMAGKIAVATHETLAIHILPEVLESFCGTYPDIAIEMKSGRVGELIRGLLHEEYHLAVTVEPFKDSRITSVPIYGGHVGFFAAPDPMARYPALRKHSLSLEEANSVPILTDVEADLRAGLPLPQALAGAGLSLDNLFALNSFEASMRLAAKGIGIAFVAERNASDMVRQGLLRPIRIRGLNKQMFRYNIHATYLKKNAERRAIGELVECFKAHL